MSDKGLTSEALRSANMSGQHDRTPDYKKRPHLEFGVDREQQLSHYDATSHTLILERQRTRMLRKGSQRPASAEISPEQVYLLARLAHNQVISHVVADQQGIAALISLAETGRTIALDEERVAYARQTEGLEVMAGSLRLLEALGHSEQARAFSLEPILESADVDLVEVYVTVAQKVGLGEAYGVKQQP
ncbi:MAG: hypothetical protein H6502_03435 [Candidatus Woesearchaeota archaeon]|nr:MAG: hypothetical protein H6502_03435 [Candidatus Woesearchaeota archaeon]